MAENVGSLSRLVTEVKIKKTRASKPKVKTGCQTCKIRRVKCDETKPSCLRCVRFGHQCDGYSNKSPSKAGSPSSSKSSRTLVPKSPTQSPLSPATSYTTTFSPVSSCSTIKLCPSPPRNLFQTQHEHEAFQTFCTRTSYQLSSAFSSDLWTRLMVQACETEPSIRHAVIEIGALNLTAPLPRPESSVGTLKHNFAYRQYSKALCLLQRDVAGGICDLRTTLIACLLFYCFESFHGYHELAISQVYSGLKLIREWTTSYYKPDDSGRQRTRIGSEDPFTVEDDILRAFGNLEIQVMTYADGRSREAHEHYRHLGQEAIDDMPSVFGSLQEARTLLELVIRRSMHWLRSTMRLQNFSTPSASPNSSPTWGEASDSRAFSLFFDVDPTFEERIKTMEEYDRWDDAFKPLLNRSRSRSAPEEDFLLASTLRLHWLSGYLSIASNNSYSSLVNNGRFTTELEELVGISRILLSRGEELCGEEFIFDMQILVPLMTVGWIYRHRALRREAIELLLRSPRKEGVWDGIVVGKIMAWLAGIEEEGLDDDASEDEDYIPEWATARCIKMSFDTERREASVSCLQPVRGSLRGEEVRREVIIPW